MEVYLQDKEHTKELGSIIAKNLKPGDVLFLKGDLGTGKTTLTKEIAKFFNCEAKSPTFSFVNIYDGDVKISHIDLYRLESYNEALSIGIEDILSDNTIKIIEWPEILGDEPYDLLVEIFYDEDGRRVNLSGNLITREGFLCSF